MRGALTVQNVAVSAAQSSATSLPTPCRGDTAVRLKKARSEMEKGELGESSELPGCSSPMASTLTPHGPVVEVCAAVGTTLMHTGAPVSGLSLIERRQRRKPLRRSVTGLSVETIQESSRENTTLVECPNVFRGWSATCRCGERLKTDGSGQSRALGGVAEPESGTKSRFTSTPGALTVMSYNILAPRLVSTDRYPSCPIWALAEDYRSRLVRREVEAMTPDIAAFQEMSVDCFERPGLLGDELRTHLGYDCCHVGITDKQGKPRCQPGDGVYTQPVPAAPLVETIAHSDETIKRSSNLSTSCSAPGENGGFDGSVFSMRIDESDRADESRPASKTKRCAAANSVAVEIAAPNMGAMDFDDGVEMALLCAESNCASPRGKKKRPPSEMHNTPTAAAVNGPSPRSRAATPGQTADKYGLRDTVLPAGYGDACHGIAAPAPHFQPTAGVGVAAADQRESICPNSTSGAGRLPVSVGSPSAAIEPLKIWGGGSPAMEGEDFATSPILPRRTEMEGVAIFFKRERFELLEYKPVRFNDEAQKDAQLPMLAKRKVQVNSHNVGLVAALRERVTGSPEADFVGGGGRDGYHIAMSEGSAGAGDSDAGESVQSHSMPKNDVVIIVGTAHLIWQREECQVWQLHTLLAHMAVLRAKYESAPTEHAGATRRVACVVLGDFNVESDSTALRYALNGRVAEGVDMEKMRLFYASPSPMLFSMSSVVMFAASGGKAADPRADESRASVHPFTMSSSIATLIGSAAGSKDGEVMEEGSAPPPVPFLWGKTARAPGESRGMCEMCMARFNIFSCTLPKRSLSINGMSNSGSIYQSQKHHNPFDSAVPHQRGLNYRKSFSETPSRWGPERMWATSTVSELACASRTAHPLAGHAASKVMLPIFPSTFQADSSISGDARREKGGGSSVSNTHPYVVAESFTDRCPSFIDVHSIGGAPCEMGGGDSSTTPEGKLFSSIAKRRMHVESKGYRHDEPLAALCSGSSSKLGARKRSSSLLVTSRNDLHGNRTRLGACSGFPPSDASPTPGNACLELGVDFSVLTTDTTRVSSAASPIGALDPLLVRPTRVSGGSASEKSGSPSYQHLPPLQRNGDLSSASAGWKVTGVRKTPQLTTNSHGGKRGATTVARLSSGLPKLVQRTTGHSGSGVASMNGGGSSGAKSVQHSDAGDGGALGPSPLLGLGRASDGWLRSQSPVSAVATASSEDRGDLVEESSRGKWPQCMKAALDGDLGGSEDASSRRGSTPPVLPVGRSASYCPLCRATCGIGEPLPDPDDDGSSPGNEAPQGDQSCCNTLFDPAQPPSPTITSCSLGRKRDSLDFLSHPFALRSAYTEYCEAHPTRVSAVNPSSNGEGKVLDHLLFESTSFRCLAVAHLGERVDLPNKLCPSDHYPIGAILLPHWLASDSTDDSCHASIPTRVDV